MAGDDPQHKTETRLCEKRSQTAHGMQSKEETSDVSTEEPGSKSEVVQACLCIENKILCIFGNLSPVFEFYMENMPY